ncbi:MAG: hypothetical protein SOT46_01795, partial [Treponema sp.]|nr:hypothetical protein [Treponema sp.]
FLWLLRSGSLIVSIPQKACSALLRGFESRNRDWEPKNRIFVYNAFALEIASRQKNTLKCIFNLHYSDFQTLYMKEYT